MHTIRLGRSDLDVTPICLGTWQFGGEWGSYDAADARATVRRALELGINFFDTAQGYGFGESEQLLGDALADELKSRRGEIVIATKGGLRPDGDGVARDASAEWLREGIDSSLQALGVDHIDLYQVHWPDEDVAFEETAGALADAVRAGKIRHVGVSNFDADQLERFEAEVSIETLQPPYHLFRRDIEEAVLPWCREHDTGVLVYGPLAHGLLTGRFDADTELPEDDWRAGTPLFSGAAFERNLEVVERLRAVADERGHSLSELAVAWTLAKPGVHCAIVGARRPDQIEGTASAAEVVLSEQDVGAIEAAMTDAQGLGGPSPEGV